MKTTGWLAAPIGLMLGLSACATAAPDSNNPLAWLDDARPQRDAMAALEKNDFRLMALPMRQLVIPGVEPELASQYEMKCGVHLIEGAGDAVRDREQLEWIRKANRYAADYNAIIKTRCQP